MDALKCAHRSLESKGRLDMKNLKTLIAAAFAVTALATSAPAFAKANHANSQSASSGSTNQWSGNPDRQWHGENSQMND
jgi:hypothetical protein